MERTFTIISNALIFSGTEAQRDEVTTQGHRASPWLILLLLFSQSVVSNSVIPWTINYQAPLSMRFPKQEYWSGLRSLLQGILMTEGLNPNLLHCRQILYHRATRETHG